MARIYGSNRVVGTVGGIRHYRLPGCDFIVAAEKGGASKELIKNNPAFARTRENNEEWKGVTKLAKQVKISFGLDAATVVNRFLIGALNKAMLTALRRNPLEYRGQRSIFLSAHKDVLDAIVYYYYKPFKDVMHCRFEVDTGPDRKSMSVRLTNLIPKEQIKAPGEATHFQLFLHLGVVCDLVFDLDNNYYREVYDGRYHSGSGKTFLTDWIPIDAGSMGDLTLTAELSEDYPLKDDMTVTRCFGITFGKMMSKVEELKKNRGSIEFLGAV